jgi:cellulose biosynthesis protein BcsQ
MKTVAIINGSPGSGRTELSKTLAAWLQQRAQARVLLIDVSSLECSNLSSHFLRKDQIQSSHATILGALAGEGENPLSLNKKLDLFVGNASLHRADEWLINQHSPKFVLQRFFKDWHRSLLYDYTLIDGNPSFDLLTQNAIVAANYVLAPRGVRRSVADMAENSLSSTFEAVRTFRTEPLTEDRMVTVRLPLDELTSYDWADLTDHIVTCLTDS